MAWVDAADKALPPPQDVKPEHKPRLAKRERQGGPFDNLMSEGKGRFDLALRIRTLEVDIPANRLRPGTNVLALEIHRAPFFGKSTLLERPNSTTHPPAERPAIVFPSAAMSSHGGGAVSFVSPMAMSVP